MSSIEPARRAVRGPDSALLAALAALSALSAAALLAPSAPPLAPGPPPRLRGLDAGRADGVVPDGVSVFDDQYPALTRLDSGLRDALRRAATAAAQDGVTFFVNSGWRSPKYQEQLLREAVSKYGSEEKAARWVASPSTSAHVSGKAVDLGPLAATAWLSRRGARYGLCQIYSDEPWHYERRPNAAVNGCPPMYADPTHDPRLQ